MPIDKVWYADDATAAWYCSVGDQLWMAWEWSDAHDQPPTELNQSGFRWKRLDTRHPDPEADD